MKARNKKKKITKIQKILYSRLFLGVSFFIVVVLSVRLYENYQQSKDVYQEISQLEDTIRDLEKKNDDIIEVIEYLKSTEYVEAQAKEKLGLAYSDEKSIIITDEVIERLKKSDRDNHHYETSSYTQESYPINQKRKNYQLWWDYFFNNM